MQTQRDLRTYADERFSEGDYRTALHAYTALVRLAPHDLDARLRLADGLLALGEVQQAATVYTALARHCANAGYPLRALVALKVLEALEPQLGRLVGRIAELYAKDSPRLGRGSRPSLADLEASLPADWAWSSPPDAQQVVARAQEVGASLDELGTEYPDVLPPVPLFSELPADAFTAVLQALKLVRTRRGEAVVRQGEPGHSFFVIARGRVQVSRTDSEGQEHRLASLADGSLFGEMALVSAQPRAATVTAVTDCDLLEFDRDALQAAAHGTEAIARALDKFTRERLLENVMGTAPLFRPLTRKQRRDLIRRFTAHEVPAGTDVVRQGEPGRGLFVVLSGDVDVTKDDGNGARQHLATLGAGDVFGEISLLYEQAATATVTARSACKVLFLDRAYFQRLVEAMPDIRRYVDNLSQQRLMDMRLLSSNPHDRDDAADEGDIALDEEDLAML